MEKKLWVSAVLYFALLLAAIGFLTAFVVGCGPVVPNFAPPDHRVTGDRVLAVVAPSEWRDALAPYLAEKRVEGFRVYLLSSEREQWGALAGDLAWLHPDYVFLVGDQSLIPTVYTCSDITWSQSFGRACLYDDSALSGTAVVGRLLTHDVQGVRNYVLRAALYSWREPTREAYLVSDQEYGGSLDADRSGRSQLAAGGIRVDLGTLNGGAADAQQASAQSVSAALSTADLVSYFGHGAADGWGYYLNIPGSDLRPSQTAAAPLVVAEACETARSAPNVPWYPYVDSHGHYQHLAAPPFVDASEIPDPSPTQPASLLSDSVAARLTSDQLGGAMVYIGETVVTSSDDALLPQLYRALLRSYGTQATIGDAWASVAKTHQSFWQFTGDPSTWFR